VTIPAPANENLDIAAQLREAAALLETRDESPFRVAAYRHASDSVRQSPQSVREIFDARGRAGLQALPGVGAGISSAIAEMLITGKWSLLERLRGNADPTGSGPMGFHAEREPQRRQLEMELV
jgi:DNA polymerase/3'-5' exonuclease PolX